MALDLEYEWNHTHSTWAGTYQSYPSFYVKPKSLEELRQILQYASRYGRRVCVVGCGHSPSTLTCTSAVLINIDYLDSILDVDQDTKIVTMEAGIRLHDLISRLKPYSLSMPNIGSIDQQSIAGAISTSTHGSSLRHGLLSQSLLALKIMLADGSVVRCSKNENLDLFRAALVSLGALGIIVEVEFQAAPAFRLQWEQTLLPLTDMLRDWHGDTWKTEFTRCWWMPYTKKMIRWRASRTEKPIDPPKTSLLGNISFHMYQFALYIANWMPFLLPTIERFVHVLHYGAKGAGATVMHVQEGPDALLMDCLYSQLVNEWAIPLQRGPEAITRLSRWLNREECSGIPFSAKGVYVHAPIEVRVTDTSTTTPRPYLDFSVADGPTLFLNATLYRPYHRDPTGWQRYYEAFEWLMKDLGGKPHWAKNFITMTKPEFRSMYPGLPNWLRVRNKVDPEGKFVGDWHRRHLLDGDTFPLEERMTETRSGGKGGDLQWFGEMANSR